MEPFARFLSGSRLRVLTLTLACLATLLVPSAAGAGENPPVAVEVMPGTPEIDPVALREAVARELDTPVLDGAGAGGAAFTLRVSIDREHDELVVERRDGVSGMSRHVPLPADPREAIHVAVFLIGNLARDEAADVLRQLRPPPSSDEAPHPSPEASPILPARDEGTAPLPRRRRFWLGAAFAYDLVFMPGADDVCTLTLQAVPLTQYDCTVSGRDFPSRAATAGDQTFDIVPGESDSVAGGISPGNFRILGSLDYAPTTNLMIGLRFGYVGNRYNGAAATGSLESRTTASALDLELRGTYVLGKDPIGRKGLAAYVMSAAGLSQYSAATGVTVISTACARIPTSQNLAQCPQSPPPPPCPTNKTSCTTAAQAWVTSGPAFGSIGVGLRWAVTPEVALLFGQRFNVAFGPTLLASTSPELGVQYGF